MTKFVVFGFKVITVWKLPYLLKSGWIPATWIDKLDDNKKAEIALAAKIKNNSHAFIQDSHSRAKTRQKIIGQITDELESKCGDDAFFYAVPRQDPGLNQKATSRAQYPLLKIKGANFSENFVISCSETVDRLECFDLETLRSMARRLMHSLMSKSIFLSQLKRQTTYSIIWFSIDFDVTFIHEFPWKKYAAGNTVFEICGLPDGFVLSDPNNLSDESLFIPVEYLMRDKINVQKKLPAIEVSQGSDDVATSSEQPPEDLQENISPSRIILPLLVFRRQSGDSSLIDYPW